MLIRIVDKLYRSFILPYKVQKEIQREQQREEYLVLMNFSEAELEPLNDEEKALVHSVFGEDENSQDYPELGLFKKHRGFDPRYIPHRLYLPLISHKLNNYHYTKMFEHKSLQGHLVRGNLKSPFCFVRCIDNEYYDNNMNQLSRNDAIDKCLEQDSLIVKDSLDSAGGQSVEKLNLSSISNKHQELEKVFSERKRDFVIQECISQHPSMAKFNESSINTLRVTTLYLNGTYSTLSIVLRFGKKGMKVDNWGAGGILVGVTMDGQLNDFGYDIQLNKYYEYNGITFKHEKISQVPSLLKKVEEAHKNQYSLCKFIGWDICFNLYNEPIIIELNSSQPGVIGEQLCTGPIFGDRTLEVLDYCKNKKFIYHKTVFNY